MTTCVLPSASTVPRPATEALEASKFEMGTSHLQRPRPAVPVQTYITGREFGSYWIKRSPCTTGPFQDCVIMTLYMEPAFAFPLVSKSTHARWSRSRLPRCSAMTLPVETSMTLNGLMAIPAELSTQTLDTLVALLVSMG